FGGSAGAGAEPQRGERQLAVAPTAACVGPPRWRTRARSRPRAGASTRRDHAASGARRGPFATPPTGARIPAISVEAGAKFAAGDTFGARSRSSRGRSGLLG